MWASSASPAIIQTNLFARVLFSNYLNEIQSYLKHQSFLSRLTKSVNKTPSGMLSETIVLVKTQPMKCFLAVSGFIFLRNDVMLQGVVKADLSGLFSFQYRQCTRFRSLKAMWLDWCYPGTLGIDILFSFCIKQWDKFKLDYSEQD